MKKILTLTLFGILAVVLIGYGIASAVKKDKPTVADGSVADYSNSASDYLSQSFSESLSTTAAQVIADITGQSRDETAKGSAGRIDDYEYAYAGFTPAYANVSISDWKMLLVNRDYILPEDYEVKLAPSITSDPDSMQLDYRVAPHYNEMYLAALEDGIELTPVSGYRSLTRQRNNFERKIEKYIDEGYSRAEATRMAAKIILPPGTSEHNAGLAMDICSLYESFENSAEFKWLSENAADYGFILRYPKDKQDITKIIYEPWHWRYVGVEAAKAMKASGECFEEYLGVA
ncbi:MAG: M15 family metallopeptidase [Oscillospiraceae bacterium]|nr:M15 family metallopeptidase [Clostridiaceae bacterium]MDY5948429.1 M15 family metallopeptidase [Oscillospiraceae bacterium]